jgi:hypothetical protein
MRQMPDLLPYRNRLEPEDEPSGSLVPLFVLPVLALLVGLGVFGHAMEEPYMVFTFKDLLIAAGGPTLIAAMWAIWLVVALKGHRLAWHTILAVAIWGIINIWLVGLWFFDYLHEPWSYLPQP